VNHTGDDQTSHDVIAHAVSALVAEFRNGSALAGPKDSVSGLERVPTGSAVLVVRRGPNAGYRFRLDQPIAAAGRHLGSNIVLDDITVSRRHAEIRCERGEFRVVDPFGCADQRRRDSDGEVPADVLWRARDGLTPPPLTFLSRAVGRHRGGDKRSCRRHHRRKRYAAMDSSRLAATETKSIETTGM
jgi:FHA domain